MRVSEIRVKGIRVNQGLGVFHILLIGETAHRMTYICLYNDFGPRPLHQQFFAQ